MLLTAQEVKLQVALSHVGLVTVMAMKLATDILDRIECALGIVGARGSDSRAARSAAKKAPATVGADGVRGPFDLIHAIGHNTATAIGRVLIGLGHNTVSRDRTQGRKDVSRRGNRRSEPPERGSHGGLGRVRIPAHLLARTAVLLLLSQI